VSSRSGRHGWGSSGTLRGCLKEARVGGGRIGYVLVPRRTEKGEDFTTDRTGNIERGRLTAAVDTERGGGIATSYHRLLEASFQTALISTPVGGTVVEESADWAGLCLFFAQGSRVTKTPALPALRRLGGGVGGSDRAGTGEKANGFAETGNMKWVDRNNNRSCALLSPLCRIRLQEPSPKDGGVNSVTE